MRRPPPPRGCWLAGVFVHLAALSGDSLEAAEEPAQDEAAGSRFAARGLEPPDADHDASRFTGDWQRWHSISDANGFHFELGYTAEVLATVTGGLQPGVSKAALAEFELRIEPSKWGRWEGLLANVSFIYPHGQGPTARNTGDLFTVSNLDAYDSPRLYELWVEQRFADDRLSVRAGQLSAESDFVLTEASDDLVNGTFGWPAFLALNVPSPGYPLTTPGVRVAWQVTDGASIKSAIFDGNPDPGGIFGEPANPHGARFNLSEGALVMTEVGYSHRRAGETTPVGSWRMGYWHLAHTTVDVARTVGGGWIDGSSPPRMHANNWGVYLAADHQLWQRRGHRSAETGASLGWFTRLATAPADRNLLSVYAETGLHFHGAIPGRNDDVTAFGIGWGRISPDLRGLAAESARLAGTTPNLPDFECVVELTHRFSIRPGWSLQPDFQWILHPGGSGRTPDAVVLSLRTGFVF